MDRLICGDVGFGKTEVAIRAAFMIANSTCDQPAQVAIVVPTTILCKQHYLRFLKRFKDFGLNVVQLSGLISNSDAKIIKEQINTTTMLLNITGKFRNTNCSTKKDPVLFTTTTTTKGPFCSVC